MALKALTPEEIAYREKTRPRSYDLSDHDELRRLLVETIGYARVSYNRQDGTDREGRLFALEALDRAHRLGFVIAPPPVS